MGALKIFSFKTIISTRKTKCFALPNYVTIRVFQHKLLNNVLFLNKMLHRFKISHYSLYSFCSLEEESPIHIFYCCNHGVLYNKKRQRKGLIIFVLNLFPLWFSTLNDLLIMDFLSGIISREVIQVSFGFLMFSGSIKGEHWEETSQAF